MPIDTTTPRTRRAILVGVGGALAGLAAQALGRPSAAAAGSGSVMLGAVNTSNDTTVIRNRGTRFHPPVLRATTAGWGIGVHGHSRAGVGVLGNSPEGTGVNGVGGDYGVHGQGDIFGVQGFSEQRSGVYGHTFSGIGVEALSDDGWGVYADCGDGIAVGGYSVRGTALLGSSVEGFALRTDSGRLSFGPNTGIATIPASARHATVAPGFGVADDTKVLATIIEGNPGDSTTVQRVTKDNAAGTFTIHLTADAINTVKVGWFAIS